MRLKHVPKADGIIENSPLCIKDPENRKGQWNRVFQNENPIYIEIGTGKGQFILEQARRHPDRNYIGIEMYTSVLYKAVEKAQTWLESEKISPDTDPPGENAAAGHPAPSTSSHTPAAGHPAPSTSSHTPAAGQPAPSTSSYTPAAGHPAPATSSYTPSTDRIATHTNLLFLRADARLLPEYFAKGEAAGIYLNFSDPWPKARHAKRRLTSERFLACYRQVLAPEGRVEFKTDNRELFDYSLETIEGSDEWEIREKTFDLHRDDRMKEGNVMTEYEERFTKQGKPICKLIAGMLCLLLAVLSLMEPLAVTAEEVWPSGIQTESLSAVVMELESGAVLYDKHPNKEYYPASITKIMTALVAVENSKMNEVVKFSKDAVYLNEGDTSHIAREVGEKMTMEQCLYGMLLESANECAWAIAEHCAPDGKMSTFVDMMNKRAKQIGCKHTHFNNPNGLPDEKHYTCSYDMALISREAFKNKAFRTITGTRTYTIPPTNKHSDPTLLNNHHSMLHFYRTNQYMYDGCLGGKTGYTVAARNTLVTFAKRKGMTLICVVMNAPSPGYYTDTIRLFDYYFDNFVTYAVADTPGLNSTNKTSTGSLMDASEQFVIDDAATIVLPKTASVLDTVESVKPIKGAKEDEVGELEFTYAGHYVGGGKLYYKGTDSYSYPFRNVIEDKDSEAFSFVRIDFSMIMLAILAVAGILALAMLIHWISPVLHMKRMRRRDERKAKKPRYRVIKNNGRKRKRRK